MADDISIFVKVVGQKDIVATTNSLNKLEAGVKRLSSDLSKGRIDSNQYTTGLRELRKGVDSSFTSWQKAKSAVDQYSKQVQQAQAIQKQAQAAIKAEAQALKDYRQARREATAENQRFDAEQQKSIRTAREAANANRRLRMEFREGYAAQVQLRAAQMRLSQAFRQGIVDSDQYEAQLQQLTLAQKNLGNAAMAGGRKMSGTGMAIQQTGYQVGDFLVQIQGGTNAMVAFGQQATQLVGVLPMVASNLGLSMKAAIGLSAGLGIAIPLLTAIGAAFMRSRPPAEEATTSFEGVRDALNKIEEVNFDSLGQEFLETAKEIREEFSNILGIIEDVARNELEDSLAAPLRAVIADLESFERRASVAAQIQAGTPNFGGQFGLESRSEALFLATQLARLDGETKEELQGQLEAISEALFLRGILTEEVKATLVELAGELSLMESINLEAENTVAAAQDIADRQETLREGAQGFLNIWKLITTEISNSTQRIINAQRELDRMRIEFSPRGRALAAYGGRGTVSDRPLAGDVPEEEAVVRGRSGVAAAKTPAELAAEAVTKLQEQLKVQRELVGATQAEVAVRQSLGDNFENVSPKIVQGLQEQYAEVQKLIEIENQRQSLADQVANTFGDGLMTMVEGTKSVKDAFKDMARAIIKDLYEVYVMQQIVGSAKAGTGIAGAIGRLLPNANGNAFSGGRVTPFANGGVVGSPTMFPMAGGKTGLMGEAGPEAIMPLKRGSDGKLGVSVEGGSGSVNVTNNINVTGGTDPAAIRMEVAKLMPQITNATKSAVIDARRRGGQMKATFG